MIFIRKFYTLYLFIFDANVSYSYNNNAFDSYSNCIAIA